jgi:protein involved in polysaccharide export with SLBB domain
MTKSELNQLTLEQLSALNKLVVNTIKLKRKQLIAQFELNIGDKVKVNHPKLQGKSLIVKKVKRTTATLQVEGAFASYNVPISMIEIS